MAEREITLSIVSHGQGVLAQRMLDRLASLQPSDVTRVVVIRNLPEAWTPTLAGWPVDLVVEDSPAPRGFAANHNAAFAHCTTPYFAVLNPDLGFDDDPFPALLHALQADARLALVAPRIVGPDGTPEDAARPLITPLELIARRLGHRAPADAPAWLAGMFFLLRSDAFRTVGGFDARYRMYCEDFDLCARLVLAGYRFEIVPAAHVVHDARRKSLRAPRHFAWHVRSLLRMWTGPVWWRYRRVLARGHTR